MDNTPNDCIYWSQGMVNAISEYKTETEREAYHRGYVEGYGIAWLRYQRNAPRTITLPHDVYEQLRTVIADAFINNPNHHDLDPNIWESTRNGVTILTDALTLSDALTLAARMHAR